MKANICFYCKKAVGKCSWSEVDPKTKQIRYEPVPGWTAEPTIQKKGKTRTPTYSIKACPEFEPDEDYKGQKSTTPRRITRMCKWCGGQIPMDSMRVSFCAKCNPYDMDYSRRTSYMNSVIRRGGKRELPDKYKSTVPQL